MADEITLTLEPPYIGSAYSPQVTVEEIEGGHAVTITSDVPGEGIVAQTFDVLDGDATQAIEDAEAAAAAARAAASSASSAATSATNAASAASTAAGEASTAAGAATDAASAATGAAASASTAAADATEAAGLADDATTAATAAASNAGTATREAIAATTAANNAAATANAAAGSAAIAAADATTAAGTAAEAAASATTAASAAGTAATAANDAADAANDAADAATEAAEGITDAWLPRVTVGASDGITGGGPLDTAAWTERACPGSDGPARIESIHGRTLRWNQLVKPQPRTATASGVAYTMTEDGKATLSGTATRVDNFTLNRYVPVNVVAGHKYVAIGSDNASVYLSNDNISTQMYSNVVYTASTTAVSLTSLRIGANFTGTYECYPQLFDLTRMFGAGNEPSTVAEFEAMYPASYYPYDAGSLQPVRMAGVESVGDGWTFQRAIDAGVLRGAGSVYDELTADERIVRVGDATYDGTGVTWTYGSGNRFYSTLSDAQAAHSDNGLAVMDKLPLLAAGGTSTAVDGFNIATMNGAMRLFVSIEGSHPEITTVAAFNTWLASNTLQLHYALATPTTTPIDPPLNMTYKAAAGGTERILHDDPTAPPTMVIQYGSTADGIRDRALEAIAAHDGPVAQSYHAVGTYLTMGGHLYRVTTAIAAGERITAGTNVTATTVMAEVLALTQ